MRGLLRTWRTALCESPTKEGALHDRGNMNYKFPVKAGFVYNKAPQTVAVLTLKMEGMLCI
jgi:hypothetical protein